MMIKSKTSKWVQILGHQEGYICVGLKAQGRRLYWNKGPWLIEGVKHFRHIYIYIYI